MKLLTKEDHERINKENDEKRLRKEIAKHYGDPYLLNHKYDDNTPKEQLKWVYEKYHKDKNKLNEDVYEKFYRLILESFRLEKFNTKTKEFEPTDELNPEEADEVYKTLMRRRGSRNLAKLVDKEKISSDKIPDAVKKINTDVRNTSKILNKYGINHSETRSYDRDMLIPSRNFDMSTQSSDIQFATTPTRSGFNLYKLNRDKES